MRVIERRIQRVRAGMRDRVMDLEKRFAEAEAPYGVPTKRHLLCIGGPYDLQTIIWEREWPSLAELEAAVEKTYSNPVFKPLMEEAGTVFESTRNELFTYWE